MDNLTHSLVGVLLARAGLRRLSPQATAISVVAANIPDIDIVTVTSSISYLNYHRHLTHGLPAVPVMAVLAVALVRLSRWLFRRSGKEAPFFQDWLVAFAAALTHPLLDLANTYGVRLWLPFSAGWFSWDILFILDFWVWTVLLLMTLGPMLLRLVHREIGVEPTRGRLAASAGLLLVVAYMGGKAVLHERAITVLDSFAYDGKPALRVAAFPPPIGFNPFLWTGLVETERYYQTSDLDLLTGNYDPMAGARFYKEEPGPALEAALRSEVGADFARFARYMLSEVTDTPDGYAVQLSDLRFRRPGRAGFLCTIEMDRHYRVKGEDFGF